VNVSSGAAARPDSMVRGNAYVTAKTALEAHTLNLAAELDGSGVTVNVYARGRFPTPEALACLAGVAPSTRQSGKVKVVAFRWAVDKQLRDAVVEFAGDSRLSNAWAADLYRQARARGHDHPHAVRVLARGWIYIIWHCWQDGVGYDPARHRALQRLLGESGAA